LVPKYSSVRIQISCTRGRRRAAAIGLICPEAERLAKPGIDEINSVLRFIKFSFFVGGFPGALSGRRMLLTTNNAVPESRNAARPSYRGVT
jgi:hypothetical protein